MQYTRSNLGAFSMILALTFGCQGQPASQSEKHELARAAKADAAGWETNPSNTCEDTCATSFDGECDDGRPGADWSICAPGTDCGDCGDWDERSGECAPTGVACTPECEEGTIPGSGGAPCQEGSWNERACTCDPLEDEGGQCAPTGVACLLDCSDAMGAPCQEGSWNAQTCTCDPAPN